jgi:hypothetical protein
MVLVLQITRPERRGVRNMLGTFARTYLGFDESLANVVQKVSSSEPPPGATLACTKLMKQKDRHERDPVRACL